MAMWTATSLVVVWTAVAAALDIRGPLNLTNAGDLSYYAHIELNGKDFRVLVDTGSADLWVAGSVDSSIDTGVQGEVKYAVGGVKGPIKMANFRLGSYTVLNQTFMLVEPDDQHPEGQGILGLGPSTGSFITDTLPSPTGSPMLYRYFHQNLTTPNYFTVLLGRDKDPTDDFPGAITIGEVLPDHPDILDQPRLEVVRLPQHREDDQHLNLLLDSDGLIGPDNLPIRVSSVVPTADDKSRLTVVLDTGFTLPQISRSVAEAIYGRFHGAEYVNVAGVGNTYILPCDSEVNLTFRFAGRAYPMHPLDMTMDPSGLGLGSVTNSKGELSCVATFQPFSYDRGSNPTYDMVLGMAFLRNVYTLFDYGDFIPSSDENDPPYVQLLSITEPAEAHSDFVAIRLGGIDVPPRPLLNSTKNRVDSNDDEQGKSKATHAAAIGASVAVIGVLLIVAALLVVRAKRRKTR